MKWKILIYGYWGIILFLFNSCKRYHSVGDVYDTAVYYRLTSYSDSVENMFVIYRSIDDTNRTFIKYYWDNGNLQAFNFFYKNQKDGVWKQYFIDGKLAFEGRFSFGNKIGVHTIYSEKGEILSKEDFSKNNE
jgi:antitoxin component YwqK of YwqJK toxin-antitoxin module